MVAGPGTGKTSCIAARVSDLILKDKVAPKEILAVTFTRAAAAEMRHKLEKQGVAPDQLPDVRTLHSKAVSLLRRYHSHVGLGPLVRPLGDSEVRLVMKDAVADLVAKGITIPFKGKGRVRDYLRAYRSEESGAGVPQWASNDQKNVTKYLKFKESYEDLQQFQTS